MAEAIRVLVVDDHAVVRAGLRGLLELQDGIEVVGDAEDGAAGVEAATRLRPDVVLMDIVMPTLDGVAAMRELRERLPEARVIVLTSFLDEDKLLPALRAGAAGYLLKNAEPQEVVRAVRTAHAGETLLDPVVAARLVELLATDDRGDPIDRLTPREREVLVLIGRGYANKRIALELGLAEKTVKTHVGHVLAKLGVSDRTQAAVAAVRAGLVPQRSGPDAMTPRQRGALGGARQGRRERRYAGISTRLRTSIAPPSAPRRPALHRRGPDQCVWRSGPHCGDPESTRRRRDR